MKSKQSEMLGKDMGEKNLNTTFKKMNLAHSDFIGHSNMNVIHSKTFCSFDNSICEKVTLTQ